MHACMGTHVLAKLLFLHAMLSREDSTKMNNIELDNELQQRLHDGHDFRGIGFFQSFSCA